MIILLFFIFNFQYGFYITTIFSHKQQAAKLLKSSFKAKPKLQLKMHIASFIMRNVIISDLNYKLSNVIMFHHQKSSRSSDDNPKQINLLQPKQRDSKIVFTRASPNLVSSPPTRSSQTHPKPSHYQLASPLFDSQSHSPSPSPYPGPHVDISQSLLTNPRDSNRIIGFILFVLLIALTPTELIALYGSEQVLSIGEMRSSGFAMLEFLAISQLAAFGVLYWTGQVEDFGVLVRYMGSRARENKMGQQLSLITKIIIRPYLLATIVIAITVVWEISYACVLLEHDQIQHLIVFYVIILPQIAGSLYFQEELHKSKKLLALFYLVLVYLGVCAFFINSLLLTSGITGIMLIYLSIRAGRMCLFLQYITKLIILITTIILHIASQLNQDEDQFTADYYPQSESPPVLLIVLLIVLSSCAIIAVRCLNNKILRIELYKYFYTDTFINNALLFIPILLGLVENMQIDVLVGVLGCAILFGLGIAVENARAEIRLDRASQRAV